MGAAYRCWVAIPAAVQGNGYRPVNAETKRCGGASVESLWAGGREARVYNNLVGPGVPAF